MNNLQMDTCDQVWRDAVTKSLESLIKSIREYQDELVVEILKEKVETEQQLNNKHDLKLNF